MRIGVDASCWGNTRGYGRHARALLRALVELDPRREYTFFVDTEDMVDELPSGVKVRTVPCSRPATIAARAAGHRTLADMWRMGRAMADPELDVLLFPTVYSFVPVLSRSKKIVVIHDVIAETFPQLTLPGRASRLFWNIKVALGRMQASALVTVSDYSRGKIVDHFRMDPARVFVVGEANDPVFRVVARPRLTPRLRALGMESGSRRVVYVGGFGPHKNLEVLVDAFAALSRRSGMEDVRLILVGNHENEVFHSYFSSIHERIRSKGLLDRVTFTGYLPDDELVTLFNISSVLVLPSLMEGFGLPAVEAAACGLPVIATTASPLPALLGDGGVFVDPRDGDGWLRAVSRVLSSSELRARMGASGVEAANQLSWHAAARQMMNVLSRVAV